MCFKNISQMFCRGLFCLAFVLFSFFFGPVFSANFAYVSNSSSNSVSVVDRDTQMTIATIPVGTNPEGLVLTPDGAFVYVANGGNNNVSVISTQTMSVVHTVNVGASPGAVAITPDGKHVYVACFGSSTISVIDTTLNPPAVTATIPSIISGQFIAFTPNGATAYVAASTRVYVIDTSSNMVTHTFTSGFTNASVVAISGNLAYVNETNAIMTVINTQSLMVGPTFSGFATPRGIAISPDGKTLYVGNLTASTVSVVNTTTNPPSIVHTITGLHFPTGIALTSDGAKLWVANLAPASVSVVDTSSFVVSSPITVGAGPISIALTQVPAVVKSPSNLIGKQKKNDFGLLFERFNVLSWEASPSTGVIGYFVYRNGIKIATLDAGILQYKDHNQKNIATLYSVTSFDAAGHESTPISVVID